MDAIGLAFILTPFEPRQPSRIRREQFPSLALRHIARDAEPGRPCQQLTDVQRIETCCILLDGARQEPMGLYVDAKAREIIQIAVVKTETFLRHILMACRSSMGG